MNITSTLLKSLTGFCLPQRLPARQGRVYLIGAGPGDPELMTLKAVRRLGEAEVLLYDRLVAPEILAMAPPGCERIYVGKHCGNHSMAQRDIEALMIAQAGAGRTVVRLKGGDPFVFGRGGEEVQALSAAGVDVEVVPGITAGIGATAYAGIPLTHRDYAQACLFITAHDRAGGEPDWQALVRPRQTVVVYMGLAGLERLSQGLIEHGLPAHWPVAVIENGTRPEQRVVAGTLTDIAARVRAAQCQSPALTVIGEVVRLAPSAAGRATAQGALAAP